VDVFYSVARRNQANRSKLLHSIHVIPSIFGEMIMYQGLSNTRTDGFGASACQSSATILNAYCRPLQYPFIPIQLRIIFWNAPVNVQSTFEMATEFETADNAFGS
jgi:hypothetical protein